MEFLPPLKFVPVGGWILLLLYIAVIGAIMFSMPKDVVARLYDTSQWSRKQRNSSKAAKVFLLLGYGSASMMPLVQGSFEFKVGSMLFLVGLLLFYSAVRSFSKTPKDDPVTLGLYQVSRNPQQVSLFIVFVGIGIAVSSWFVLGVTVIGILLSHLRILAEEEQCLKQYGENYKEYMENTPRYLLFL
jgi:protein-S-isoprenylcysteine O-methyltransferase Ste14